MNETLRLKGIPELTPRAYVPGRERHQDRKRRKEECWEDGKACLREDFLARYPFRLIPMLELDDGRQIGESTAICRYFEELYPEPSLFGRDALEKALVEMWHQRVHADGEIGAEEVVRNSFPPMAQRGLAGTAEFVAQIPALVERGKTALTALLSCFEHTIRNAAICGWRALIPKKGLALHIEAKWTECIARRDRSATPIRKFFGTLRIAHAELRAGAGFDLLANLLPQPPSPSWRRVCAEGFGTFTTCRAQSANLHPSSLLGA